MTDQTTTDVDTAARFRAYGWDVVELGDVADDLDALERALVDAKETDRPSLLILAPRHPERGDEVDDMAEPALVLVPHIEDHSLPDDLPPGR